MRPTRLPDGPVRTCVGCRRKRLASELARVVSAPDGELELGRSLAGRGAWLCLDSLSACAALAARGGRFARALRRPVAPEAVARLREHIGARESAPDVRG